MGIPEIIQDRKKQILSLAAKYGASNVRVFGSVANGTADENSNIDFLVDLEKGRSLFDLGGLLANGLTRAIKSQSGCSYRERLALVYKRAHHQQGKTDMKDDRLI